MLKHLKRLFAEFSPKQLTLLGIAIVTVVSFFTHFAYFNRQQTAVFDEVYFGSFAQSYFSNEYTFDIHPPLGKMIVAAFTPANDMSEEVKFKNDAYQGEQPNFFRMRLAPALAGFLLPIIVMLVALQLGFSRVAGTAVGVAVALENALIAQSRLILLDSFILLFGFLGFLFYLKFRRKHQFYWLALSGLFLGMAISIKWTALSFILLVGGSIAWDIFKQKKNRLLHFMGAVCCLVVIPLVFYISVFAVHFSLQNQSGPGDAFMSQEFQSTLLGNPNYDYLAETNMSFQQKFIELNTTMYTSNKSIINDHPYGSKWYSWPFLIRPMWYFVSPDGFSNIYLIGNPFTWWLSTLAVLALVIAMTLKKQSRNYTNVILLAGLLLCWLPFILISRVMFLYHYFPSLVFSMLILFRLVDNMKRKRAIIMALLTISLLSYLFIAPLTYGLQLSPDELYQRQILESWK